MIKSLKHFMKWYFKHGSKTCTWMPTGMVPVEMDN